MTLALAVEHLGIAGSATELTASALRQSLETVLMEAALDLHFEQHPDARPSLGDVAVALAQQDGFVLAEGPDEILRAALEVQDRHPAADADDVLLWVEAQRAARSAA